MTVAPSLCLSRNMEQFGEHFEFLSRNQSRNWMHGWNHGAPARCPSTLPEAHQPPLALTPHRLCVSFPQSLCATAMGALLRAQAASGFACQARESKRPRCTSEAEQSPRCAAGMRKARPRSMALKGGHLSGDMSGWSRSSFLIFLRTKAWRRQVMLSSRAPALAALES